MRSSMHVLGKYWLRCAALVGFKEGGKVLRVLSKEEEVSEWLIPRLRGVSDWTLSDHEVLRYGDHIVDSEMRENDV